MIVISLFSLVLILTLVIYIRNSLVMTYQISSIDKNNYKVVNYSDKLEAANILASIKEKLNALIEHLDQNKSKYPLMESYIDRLSTIFPSTVISENNPFSSYTSYNYNKGEEIVFCLRSKETKEIYDINLILYVALHELAHIGSPVFGHGEDFVKVFKFITRISVDIGIYQKIDFDQSPSKYCGIEITNSIV